MAREVEFTYTLWEINEWLIKVYQRANWNHGPQQFVVLESAINSNRDESHEIIKYDTEHGIFHVHKYYKKQKENVNLENKVKGRKNQYRHAVKDITEKGKEYFKEYRKNKFI